MLIKSNERLYFKKICDFCTKVGRFCVMRFKQHYILQIGWLKDDIERKQDFDVLLVLILIYDRMETDSDGKVLVKICRSTVKNTNPVE